MGPGARTKKHLTLSMGRVKGVSNALDRNCRFKEREGGQREKKKGQHGHGSNKRSSLLEGGTKLIGARQWVVWGDSKRTLNTMPNGEKLNYAKLRNCKN